MKWIYFLGRKDETGADGDNFLLGNKYEISTQRDCLPFPLLKSIVFKIFKNRKQHNFRLLILSFVLIRPIAYFVYIYWHTCKSNIASLSPSNSTHFLLHFVHVHYQILISEVIILITFHMLFGCSATCSRFANIFLYAAWRLTEGDGSMKIAMMTKTRVKWIKNKTKNTC